MRAFLLIIFFSLNLTNFSNANQEEINGFFNKLQNMKKPIEIFELGQFRDGGSINVILEGSDGGKFYFYLNRMSDYPIGSLFVYSEFPEENVIVPQSSILEKEIIKTLKEWLLQNTDPQEYIRSLELKNRYQNDPEILGRRRYYITRIIESVETSRTIDIVGAVPIGSVHQRRDKEINKYKEFLRPFLAKSK